MLKVHALDNAHGPRGQEVARHHPHPRPGHGGVGQALAKGRFNLVAQLPGRFLGAVQRHAIGNAHTGGVLRLVVFQAQLFVDLGAKAMHQHNFYAHGLDHGQVLHDGLELARCNRFARNTDNKGLVAKLVDIGRYRAKPGHKGEVEDGRHRGRHGRKTMQQKAKRPKGQRDRRKGPRRGRGPSWWGV